MKNFYWSCGFNKNFPTLEAKAAKMAAVMEAELCGEVSSNIKHMKWVDEAVFYLPAAPIFSLKQFPLRPSAAEHHNDLAERRFSTEHLLSCLCPECLLSVPCREQPFHTRAAPVQLPGRRAACSSWAGPLETRAGLKIKANSSRLVREEVSLQLAAMHTAFITCQHFLEGPPIPNDPSPPRRFLFVFILHSAFCSRWEGRHKVSLSSEAPESHVCIVYSIPDPQTPEQPEPQHVSFNPAGSSHQQHACADLQPVFSALTLTSPWGIRW